MSVEVRPERPEDLDAMARIAVDLQTELYGGPEFGLAELRATAGLPTLRRWVALDGGEVVGYAAHESDTVQVWARPTPGDAGGAALLETALASAGATGVGAVFTILAPGDRAGRARFERAGFRHRSSLLRMLRVLDETLSEPRWGDGLTVRAWGPGDAAAVHDVLVEAFASTGESVPPYSTWLPWFTGDPEYDPTACTLVASADKVVAVCLCWSAAFVKDLAVRPAFRGRGIGEALLWNAFAEFRRRGAPSVALKVDAENPTGAVRLYERVGMRVDSRSDLWTASV